MLHGLPNSCVWCVEFRACLVYVIRCESYFIGLCVCNFGELLSHIKPKSSLLSKSAKENSIMPQEFLLEPSRTQIWEGSNMWKQFLELCLQDAFKMNRDALTVSMWCFLTLSQARQTQIIQRPLRRRWAHCPKGKPYLERILQADSFGMFWLYFLVAVSWRQDERRIGTYRNHSEVPYTSYKITRSYEILGVSEYLLTGLQRFADCRCSPMGWCNMVQTLFYL